MFVILFVTTLYRIYIYIAWNAENVNLHEDNFLSGNKMSTIYVGGQYHKFSFKMFRSLTLYFDKS